VVAGGFQLQGLSRFRRNLRGLLLLCRPQHHVCCTALRVRAQRKHITKRLHDGITLPATQQAPKASAAHDGS
jgi:hypothetical protein